MVYCKNKYSIQRVHAFEIKRSRKGLTLIELIAVIAIVVILASIVLPTANTVIQSARRAKAANQLRQIAVSIAQLSQENPTTLSLFNVNNVYAFSAQFAYLTGINQACLFITEDDSALKNQAFPLVILNDINDVTSLNTTFEKATLSFAFSSKISPNASPSTTPIAWTRGLRLNGTWDPATSPYEGKGGHIVFLDGHVKWYKRLDSTLPHNQLTRYGTNISTTSILEALPPGACILETNIQT
jgi:prepilin-type N-terminal cleavage/methylation domain-containing protein/prepilin-type processing-associated H-X9-DG protein